MAQFEQEIKAQIAQQKAAGRCRRTGDRQRQGQSRNKSIRQDQGQVRLRRPDARRHKEADQADRCRAEGVLRAEQAAVRELHPGEAQGALHRDRPPKLADSIQLSQADLQQYYNQHQDDFRIPETVTVRHILIKTPVPGADGKVDQKAVDAARPRLKTLRSS